MLNTISLVIKQRKNEFNRIVNEFDRIVQVRVFPICFYALRGWNHFPDTCQGLFLAKGWYRKLKVPNLESNIKIYGQPSCQYGLNISYWPPLRLVPYQNLSPGHWAVNKSCYYMTTFWSVCLWFSRKTNVKHNLIGY
jgi:hypothetical protein